MKLLTFLKNNKWTITIAVTILNLILNQIDLSVNWTNSINILIIVLTVLQERVDEINLENKKEIEKIQLQHKGAVSIKVDLTIFTMIWEFIKSIPDDFSKETWENEGKNIPSHLLIGSSFPLLISPLHPPIILLYTVLSLSAAFVGVCIELVQKKFFEGTVSNTDIRFTWYGYFIPGLLFYHLLQWIGLHHNADLISGLVLIVLAFLVHKRKK
jgi:hypothetical protein